jgi:hypothetical protein
VPAFADHVDLSLVKLPKDTLVFPCGRIVDRDRLSKIDHQRLQSSGSFDVYPHDLRASPANYARYGAKGITICGRWSSFLADMGLKPSIGITGRHRSEPVVAIMESLVVFNRNRWSPSPGARTKALACT